MWGWSGGTLSRWTGRTSPGRAPDDAAPDTDAGAVRPSLADTFSTSVGSGVSGVSTDAFTDAHTPYCGFTLTEARRSSAVSAF